MLGILFFLWRDTLRLCAKLFQITSKGISENATLLPVNIGFAVVGFIIQIGLLAMWVLAITNVDVVAGEALGCDVSWPSSNRAYCAFGSLAYGWFVFFVLEARTYVIADTMSHWYWHGAEASGRITRAIKHAFLSHFGTLALGAILLWIIEMLRKRAKKWG